MIPTTAPPPTRESGHVASVNARMIPGTSRMASSAGATGSTGMPPLSKTVSVTANVTAETEPWGSDGARVDAATGRSRSAANKATYLT